MQATLFVRRLTPGERHQFEVGLRSSDAFVLRRCQIVLASARGEATAAIAAQVGCSDQTVRNVVWAFWTEGLDCLKQKSTCPQTPAAAFDPARAEALRALLHQSPRTFGQPTSVWTLDLAAAVSFAQGLTPTQVTGETIRATLARLGIRWRRAKQWITSPDPEYARKKGPATV
jgi:transposase